MDEKNILKKNLKYYMKTNKYKIIILYIVTILSNLLALIPLYLFGNSIDFIISKDLNKVVITVLYIAGIYFITLFLSIIETILHTYTNQVIIADLKEKIYSKILKLKLRDFNSINNGEFLTKMENDSVFLSNFITEDLINLFIDIVTIIITLILIFKLSPILTLISLITFPVSIIFTSILSKKTRKYILKGKKLNDMFFGNLQETLNGIQEIKCLNIEKILLEKYKGILNKIVKNTTKMTSFNTGINSLISLITSIGEWVIIIVAAWLIINNSLTVGILVAFNSFCAKFTNSVTNLSKFKLNIQQVYLSLNRLNDLFIIDDETDFKGILKPDLSGELTMSKLKFFYNETNIILENINLNIKPKSLNVIVGKNGSGKTSILNLLLRFYDLSSGNIFLDKYNIQDIDINYLRKEVCYIPQNPFIFSESIEENLSFKESVSMEEKIKVCKLVGIHDFIDKLPEKYNTILGNNGFALSGGEKQKLSIARGILRNPKILLLDEITSDLDQKSEVEIMNLLKKLSQNYTIITVAHRTNSIIVCPNIIVLDNSKVIAIDNHNNLMSYCNEYIDMSNKWKILE